jgi:serine/threonine protein kinase
MEKTNWDWNASCFSDAVPPATPPPDPPVRHAALPSELRSLGPYRLLRKLGEGGMGTVYLGFDVHTAQHLAIKILNDQLASQQSYIDRFNREGRSGVALNHPNIVRTYSVGQDQATGLHYLVMEYVDGPTVLHLLETRGPWPVGDVVNLGLQMAQALQHAHTRNIVHRDIKPDNILLTRSGQAKLADMGLAKPMDDSGLLTVVRTGFGTAAYMPYEQAINARNVDGRSDLYALGATMYHLLTGQLPFPGETHLEMVERKKQGRFRPASSWVPSIPSSLDSLLNKLLALQPRDRFQTAIEVIIAMENSGLASKVLSVVDPQLARTDLEAQAHSAQMQPTRPAPDLPPLDNNHQWIVCYKQRNGRPVCRRLNTDTVIDLLREDNLPLNATVRHPNETEARPLDQVPEFAPFVSLPGPTQPFSRSEVVALADASISTTTWVLSGVVSLVVFGLLVLLYRLLSS